MSKTTEPGSKTVSDYPLGKRLTLRGMWCDYLNEQGGMGVIYGITPEGDPRVLRVSARGFVIAHRPEDIVPRPDLPRAWNADGTPAR